MASNCKRRLPTTDILPKISIADEQRNPQPVTLGVATLGALGQSPSHPLTLRSNYDCIKQGQAAQLGLHYRTDLTAAANSTRNSHKRAEKNRRDRLALAMQELVMLLPQKPSTSNSSGNQRGGKAETVEIAVQYIKQLQEEVNALKRLALSPSVSRTCLHENTTAQDQ
ncbi:hypothetical protein Z517_07077 [Fonsecaea pedrosoi CBS 271.37]|uniref:BHLH domain-containing protein n=1 Tax=Fonsecaea pedrosoi CBS 271.37 TaxID=1442368 RepID=A0A0D2DRE6_9EURO|nr:uncharacterized protein Z517_07077 [Fonsecaea pedrosoi CBS 271.37]KIW80461.1 hypothetical protein Z517_07077 [Fonsecaea pedrosoi CBS 271.37]